MVQYNELIATASHSTFETPPVSSSSPPSSSSSSRRLNLKLSIIKGTICNPSSCTLTLCPIPYDGYPKKRCGPNDLWQFEQLIQRKRRCALNEWRLDGLEESFLGTTIVATGRSFVSKVWIQVLKSWMERVLLQSRISVKCSVQNWILFSVLLLPWVANNRMIGSHLSALTNWGLTLQQRSSGRSHS